MVGATPDASDRHNRLGARRCAGHLSRDRIRDGIQSTNAGALDECVASERVRRYRSGAGRRNRPDFKGEETLARSAPCECDRRAKGPQSCGDGTQGRRGGPQFCVANRNETHGDERFAERIGSSFVERIKEKAQQEIHRSVEIGTSLPSGRERENRSIYQNQAADEIRHCEQFEFQQQFHNALQKHDLKNSHSEQTKTARPTQTCKQHVNQQETITSIAAHNQRSVQSHLTRPPTQQTFPWQLRERMRLLRAERDDAVRRELAVGTGRRCDAHDESYEISQGSKPRRCDSPWMPDGLV
jgi:hypothetical protein